MKLSHLTISKNCAMITCQTSVSDGLSNFLEELLLQDNKFYDHKIHTCGLWVKDTVKVKRKLQCSIQQHFVTPSNGYGTWLRLPYTAAQNSKLINIFFVDNNPADV